MTDKEREIAREWFLLTTKPVIYACNIKEDDLGKDEEHGAAEEDDDENLLFDDLDTIAPAADDEDFKSSDLFDDYDDLDDLDSDDDI